jgi:hypothetical protein
MQCGAMMLVSAEQCIKAGTQVGQGGRPFTSVACWGAVEMGAAPALGPGERTESWSGKAAPRNVFRPQGQSTAGLEVKILIA